MQNSNEVTSLLCYSLLVIKRHKGQLCVTRKFTHHILQEFDFPGKITLSLISIAALRMSFFLAFQAPPILKKATVFFRKYCEHESL